MRAVRMKKKMEKLNLIPIMDAVFIFIFYLLMSAQFIDIYEINSDVAKLSTEDQVKKDKIPLNLTIKIYADKIEILTGVPSRPYKDFKRDATGTYPVDALNMALIGLKSSHPEEKTAIVIPQESVKYKDLVPVLDNIRNTMENNKPKALFSSISFGEF